MWWHNGTFVYSDEVSFEAFAVGPKLTDYQAQWLGSLSLRATGHYL